MQTLPHIKTLLRRDNAFRLFRSLNVSILNTYFQLKSNFAYSPPPSPEIINTLKLWKQPLEEAIAQEMCKILQLEEIPAWLNQTEVVAKIIQNYKEEQEFIELFRNVTSSVETIKDFIRTQYFRDTSADSDPSK